MSKKKSREELEKEFEEIELKNWFNVYNWNALKDKSYEEACAQILKEHFTELEDNFNNCSKNNCRENNFCQDGHDGCANIKSNEEKFTEKRMCYALYNAYNKEPFGVLGKIIDYEVPLKKDLRDKKGKIDLLGYDESSGSLNIIEVKQPNSNESILKAILEVFVYSKLVQEVKKNFVKEYNEFIKDKEDSISIPKEIIFSPNVLTFKQATSGKQLEEGLSNETKKLLSKLNSVLKQQGLTEIRFFYFTNKIEKGEKYLNTMTVGDKKRITFISCFIPTFEQKDVLRDETIIQK